ncbi:hypothetical protein QOZ84_10250 [Romboutsia sedimentorum]|uniref:CD-NTase associated protein 4-like DNA endonuclease domain-containing protein n=1 Tax=Romboutsia sedimentorum TaxID=1368474 RepID=A0ABT7EB62_9FIRM|nr:hypothetical protein [Romboutsia sedimentorum]MDK2563932.1 hypothetical protein [Romboutsia sedimentorum]
MEEQILNVFSYDKEYMDSDNYVEREKFISDKLDNKSNEEITTLLNDTIKNLIDTPVSERGGLVAITGFYYQMLAVIDYFIQMKQGKWNCVAVELHDDIVAVKDNNIRFIQVKTSNNLICQISKSPASSIYLRTKKGLKLKHNIKEIQVRVSNNWIDKLILKSKNFKKKDGFFTEFELLTNYIISNSPEIKIDKYIGRDNSKKINSNDDIYKILKEDSYVTGDTSNERIKVQYEDMCGESLKELLSRFAIESKQNSLNNIDQYLNSICQMIGTEIGGAYVSYEDINWIIGELFARCNINAKNRSLVITKNEVESLFLDIQSRAMIAATQLAEEHGTKNIVESVYETIHNDYKNTKHYKFIEMKILEYKQYLINWINNNGGINKIINRYITGNEISNKHIGMGKRDKENIIEELILMPIILIIVHNKEILYSNNRTLLTKEIDSFENNKISLLRVGKGRVKSKIVNIKAILSDLGANDILKLSMAKELNIILQGYSDSTFSSIQKLQIDTSLDCSELIEEDTSINKVYQAISLIPGGSMREWLEVQLEEDIWDENELKSLWDDMMKGEL